MRKLVFCFLLMIVCCFSRLHLVLAFLAFSPSFGFGPVASRFFGCLSGEIAPVNSLSMCCFLECLFRSSPSPFLLSF
eukprot:m.333111 g.333111  ORF g.333111 m.333111 type:complete len:77 (-) comp55645_c3_seq5:124-354(-)